MQSRRLLFALAACLTLIPSLQAAEPATVWEGRWMNRKYNTNGPLKCTAVRQGAVPGQAGVLMKATFTGVFMGEGFEYQVEFRATPNGAKHALQGVATLDGDRYQWNGSAQGNTMVGEFKSLKGNNGTFQLKRLDASTRSR